MSAPALHAAPPVGTGLGSRAMLSLLSAQFISALADNMLFILVLALIKSSGRVELVPLVQEFFVLSFILLAPFVGPLADSQPKGRVMLMANGIKLAGAGFILAGGMPLIGYAIVGIGAAAYSPAKYGILSQLFGPEKLVRANGLLEGSTIVAILLGVVAGGGLADSYLTTALWAVAGLYVLAAVLNLLIPRLPVERPLEHTRISEFLRAFGADVAAMFRHPAARFSLIGAGVFWGFGATLRILLFAWVPVALLLNDTQTPANLMGAVSVGIVVGAVLAGIFVRLENVTRALAGGLLLGPLILALAFQTELIPSAALLLAIGVAGGFFAIPLNALLQETGHKSIGAGRALAVQNLMENGMMLGMIGVYYLTVQAGLDVRQTASAFGAVMMLATGWLAWVRPRG